MLEIYSSILNQLWTLSYDPFSPVQRNISDTVNFIREQLLQEIAFYSNMFKEYQA